MPQLAFINPKAGALNGFTSLEEIKAKLARYDLHPEIIIGRTTKAMEDFIHRVKRERPKSIIIAGGDGTFSKIAKGLINTNVVIGLVPTGSVNNIGHSIGLTGSVSQALRTIKHGTVAPFDVGQVGNHYIIEGFGIGLIAHIFEQTDWDKDKKIIRLAKTAIKEVFTTETIKAEVEVDGKILVLETVWLSVTNVGRIGNLNLSPRSQPGDGVMELVYCKPLSILELPKYSASFLRAKHLARSKFEIIRVKSLKLNLPKKTTVHFDDISDHVGQVDFKVLPGALKVYTTRKATLTQEKP